MPFLGSLGGQIAIFALALLLMHTALRQARFKGLFAGLLLGALPSLFWAAGFFVQFQDKSDPEILELRRAIATQMELRAAKALPRPEDKAQREELQREALKSVELLPALLFFCHLGLLAPLAVLLRRRYSLDGSLPEAEPLWRWTAPWGFIWLVLGPALLLAGAMKGLYALTETGLRGAWNVLLLGLGLALFQGAVVLWAKLRSWWLEPASRPLVFIVLLGVFLSLWLQSAVGLVAFLLLTGLFEPWVDARRLRQPPAGPAAKP